jgi:hypothetical protein
MRAREYDPATAQFLSVDPWEALTRAPYNYALDNPLNYADPSGLEAVPFPAPVAGPCALAPEVCGAAALGGVDIYLGVKVFNTWADSEEGDEGEEFLKQKEAARENECGYNSEQDALIKIAKEAKRTGVFREEAEILQEWAEEFDVPFRGPEEHPGRPFGSQPHIHVGSQNHIPVW